MKSMKKLLIVAAIVLIAAVSISACSAGFFDFLGGDSSGDTSLNGTDIKLAAAASLKCCKQTNERFS